MVAEIGEAGDFSGRIRLAMAVRGINSEAELSRRCGVSRQTLNRWINGHAETMRAQQFIKLALVLDVNGVWLALGESNMTRPMSMSPDESKMLELFRACQPTQREAILNLLHTFGRPSDPPPDIG